MSPTDRDDGPDALAASDGQDAELAQVLGQSLPPLRAPSGLRARILASAAGHHDGFAVRVAALFDLPAEQVGALLARIGSDEGWESTALPGLRLFHLRGGPRVAAADCGFVRLEAGRAFPHHRHEGEESALVLGGMSEDSTGAVALPGDWIHFPPGSSHSFRSAGPRPLLFAVVHHGIRFEREAQPASPR